ncbi:MAG TPA: hypothetical protein VFF32_15605 [Dermatophilaceae bacterium]|nr:hypothetical protein [Dermatophilaceae bacterium]
MHGLLSMLLVLMTTSLLAACGVPAGAGGPTEAEEATVRIRLEDIGGDVFIEGFELEVEFRDAGDEVLSVYDWNDDIVVADDDIRAFYEAEHVEQVPAGPVTVITRMQLGMEQPQPPCRTQLDLAPGAEAVVTVRFHPEPEVCASVELGD